MATADLLRDQVPDNLAGTWLDAAEFGELPDGESVSSAGVEAS